MIEKVLTILFYLCIAVSAEDVAVILGGMSCSSPVTPCTYLRDVEVYTKHLSTHRYLCKGTNEDPQIPSLPMPIYGASAVFLPEFGIYLCGGRNDNGEYLKSCYRYDPRISR